jgi:hypothetical protein
MNKHNTKVAFCHGLWATRTNLHPCDTTHQDSCSFMLTVARPTARQLRAHRKDALLSKRPASARGYCHG